MKGAKKWIFNTLFLFVVIFLTFYLIFKDQDFGQTLEHIKNANLLWCGIGLATVVAFILLESVIMHYLMNTISQKSKLTHCFLYSFVGFFFSSITPSASGGQPAQAYFMRRDRISVSVSAPVLTVITVLYKAVLVIISAVVLIFRPPLMKYLDPYIMWFYLGLLLNVGFVFLLVLVMVKPNVVRQTSHFFINIYTKIFKKHNGIKLHAKVERGIQKYASVTATFKKEKMAILVAFFITFLQRIILFAITWFCLKALGINDANVFLVITLQAMISSAADMMPLPGGSGVSEILFLGVFEPLLHAKTLPAMILSRGLSYYSQMILGSIFTLFSTVAIKDKSAD